MIRREINIFLTAVMFYTRIPCPKNLRYSDDLLNRATRYFPIIGLIVGAASALVLWGSAQLLPYSIAIVFSMLTSIWITGAFHEDGFADVCDGFGGGYDKSQMLTIMKDSRIGTYGSVGLILILLLKFLLLSSLDLMQVILILPIAHILSRMAPVGIIFSSVYSRADATSKVKPIGKSISIQEYLFALLSVIVPLYFLLNIYFLLLFVPVFTGQILLKNYFEKHLDGYTGDCLGATQQIIEIGIYLSALILLQYFPL